METKVKRREWVKNAAIIFLTVLLVLTFFSNTIMNYSLPEVAAQYPMSGTITSKIRGEGTVSANESYNVTIDESRKIKGIAVKVNAQVAAGDVLFLLEDEESDELQALQTELDALVLQYQKDLVAAKNTNYAAENLEIKKAQQDLQDALDALAEAEAYDKTLSAAKEKADAAQEIINRIDAENAELASSEKLALELAKDAQAEAERLEEQAKASVDFREQELGSTLTEAEDAVTSCQDSLDQLDDELAALQKELKTLQSKLNGISGTLSDVEQAESDLQYAQEHYFSTLNAYREKYGTDIPEEEQAYLDKLYAIVKDQQAYLSAAQSTSSSVSRETVQAEISAKKDEIAAKEKEISKMEDKLKEARAAVKDPVLMNAYALYNKAKANAKIYKDKVYDAQTAYNNKISGTSAEAKQAQIDLEQANNEVAIIQGRYDTLPDYKAAKTAAQNAQNQLEALYISLNTAQSDGSISQATGELDLAAEKKKIDDMEAKIEKLQKDSVGKEITARYGGIISSLSVTAGDTTSPGEAMAVIEITDKGYKTSFSVTKEQSLKVKVGDQADITNVWGDISVTLVSITTDKADPGNKKVLTFELKGEDVTPGQKLNLSVGQRSSSYDLILPNSAVREDANGTFVLMVQAKSSPLGNRYIAKRVDVQVLEKDDTNSAVSGDFYSYDYIITTSDKPLEAGMQVRLSDS